MEVSSLDQLSREEHFLMADDLYLSLSYFIFNFLFFFFVLLSCLLLFSIFNFYYFCGNCLNHLCLKPNPAKSFVIVGRQSELGNLELW